MSNEKGFLGLLENELVVNSEYNKSITENGAVMHATSGDKLVDLFYRISSFRIYQEYDDFADRFSDLYEGNRELAILFLFYIRDIRGGLGERELFRYGLRQLVYHRDRSVYSLIPLISEYGRYDDLLVLLDTKYEGKLIEFINAQLAIDFHNMNHGKSISLLAKWLPSTNASSKKTRLLAHKLREKLGYDFDKDYRKDLSKLRNYLRITESLMSSKQFNKIKYSEVPSLAMTRYNSAFMRNDSARFNEYLRLVKSGKDKINTKTVYPYQLVSQSRNDTYNDTYDLQWKQLLKDDNFSFDNTLVVRDGSSSMEHTNLNKHVTAMDIGDSLSIYISSKLKGYYHSKFITFSSRPQLVQLSDPTNLTKSLEELSMYDDWSNTDIEAVFRLILDSAVHNKLSQDQLPDTILVISDMEFDPYSFNFDNNLFESISNEYENYGYKLPKLVFWNVSSRTNSLPVVNNDNGVIYVSGFSQNALRIVESGELTPLKSLLSVLTSPRYSRVMDVL